MKRFSPIKVFKYIRNKFILYPRMRKGQEEFIKNFVPHYADDFIEITDEVINDITFHKHIRSQFEAVNIPYTSYHRYAWPVSNYYLIRKLKPKTVIETGVWHGLSTCYILQALRANDKGKLISIDLPAYSEEGGYEDLNPFDNDDIISLPMGKNPGWIIPNYLQNRWKLILGKAEDKLPPLLEELKTIDFFLHDSEHSYSNMMFEFELAHRYLSEGGVIVADNINWNESFNNFCKENNLKPHTYLAYLEDPDLNNHPFGGTRKE